MIGKAIINDLAFAVKKMTTGNGRKFNGSLSTLGDREFDLGFFQDRLDVTFAVTLALCANHHETIFAKIFIELGKVRHGTDARARRALVARLRARDAALQVRRRFR